MKGEKRKKSGQKQTRQNEVENSINQLADNLKYKFNISMDNLRCFINPVRTDRKRSQQHWKRCEVGKYLQEKNDKEQQYFSKQKSAKQSERNYNSPEKVCNEILDQIQSKGITCQWNELDQCKSQYIDEEPWQQNQFFKTFSDLSKIEDKKDLTRSHQKLSTPDFPENLHQKDPGEHNQNNEKNHSFASTVDYPNIYYQNQNTNLMPYPMQQYPMSTSFQRLRYDPTVFEITLENIGWDPRTTLMIKNIPNKYTIQNLASEIDQFHENTYDFLYLPCDIKNNCNVGYGFINFVNTEVLKEFYLKFHNKKWLKFRSQKICVLTYARLQGLSRLIQHFQNTKVLNHKQKKYQPIIRQYSRIENLIKEQQVQQGQHEQQQVQHGQQQIQQEQVQKHF